MNHHETSRVFLSCVSSEFRSYRLGLAKKDAKELEVQVAAVLRWLERHPGWFLILDNVDTEQAAREVEELLCRLQSAGQVLVTLGLSKWSAAVERLALDVLYEQDAAAFLLERTAAGRVREPDEAARARELAVTLGQLALALEQAGAYIDVNEISFSRYLREWHERHDRVLEWLDAASPCPASDRPRRLPPEMNS